MLQTVSITESPIITNGIVIENGPLTFGVILILNGADFFPASNRPPCTFPDINTLQERLSAYGNTALMVQAFDVLFTIVHIASLTTPNFA